MRDLKSGVLAYTNHPESPLFGLPEDAPFSRFVVLKLTRGDTYRTLEPVRFTVTRPGTVFIGVTGENMASRGWQLTEYTFRV